MRYRFGKPNENDLKGFAKTNIIAFSSFGSARPTEEQSIMNKLQAAVESSHSRFILAEIEGKVVGSVAVRSFNQITWIYGMAVLPEYQRKGIGSGLLDFLTDNLSSLKSHTFCLYSSPAGIEFYQTHGFTRGFDTKMVKILHVNNPEVDEEVTYSKGMQTSIFQQDLKTMGYDRSSYLQQIMGKFTHSISIGNRGFGLLRNNVLGPVVADSWQVAHSVIASGFSNNAEGMIINIDRFHNSPLLDFIDMKYLSSECNPFMFKGPSTKIEIKKLFAICSYSAG